MLVFTLIIKKIFNHNFIDTVLKIKLSNIFINYKNKYFFLLFI